LFDTAEIGSKYLFFGNENISPLFHFVTQVDKSGTHTTFCKVAGNGIAHFFAGSKSDSSAIALFIESDGSKNMFFGGFVVKVGKLFAGAQSLEVF